MNTITRRPLFIVAVAVLLVVLLFSFRRCAPPTGAGDAARATSAAPVGSTSPTVSELTLVPVSALPATKDKDRMQLIECAMDAAGVRFVRTTPAEGRVKAPPISISPWRIEFTVYGRSGEKLYAGSIDHPLHPRHEYADATPEARLHTVFGVESEAMLQLRLPAELPAARVVFSERRPTLPADAPAIPLGEISLP